ncbi:XdhC family protein [Peribacillus sp. NPDC097675]|uniref:XdhC family protein n=1 Tax=Peribacillus sp. NPDC097675 TaxID=3390618 RepID=UPI003CFFA44B
MNQIFKILEEAHDTSMECVLATIIHVNGSAYLREGTSMLIKKDGTYTGIISAGCVETDIVHHSKRVFESQEPETIVYNLENNEGLDWGVSTGCKGILYILLEYVDQNLKENIILIKDTLKQGMEINYQRVLTKDWSILSSHFASPSSDTDQLPDILLSENPHATYVYNQTFTPKPRLIIFGAGLDAIPLVTLAASAGFLVTVCDWRESLCNDRNIPAADTYVIGFPNEIISQFTFKKEDYVIIMTHNFQRDKEILSLIKHQPLFYIGILGSRTRTARLFEMDIPKNIHAPIGLTIGAEGPYEIAVSIVAELIQFKRKKRAS